MSVDESNKEEELSALTNCVLRHNTTALQEMYLCMGKMIAISIVHGGPGPFLPSLLSTTSSVVQGPFQPLLAGGHQGV